MNGRPSRKQGDGDEERKKKKSACAKEAGYSTDDQRQHCNPVPKRSGGAKGDDKKKTAGELVSKVSSEW